jgi:hypothetical protein
LPSEWKWCGVNAPGHVQGPLFTYVLLPTRQPGPSTARKNEAASFLKAFSRFFSFLALFRFIAAP